MPYKRIAARLGVSPCSVFNWTKDIQITEAQRVRNLAHQTAGSETVKKRAATWRAKNRARRLSYQAEGRDWTRRGDPLHLAGCMLYWAEGAKDRNSVTLANSDPAMLSFFKRFLAETFGLQADAFSIRLNVYLGNGFTIEQIEDFWLSSLELPRACLRKHTINHFPTSSSGVKKDRLPYGVCFLRVSKSTWIVQHIYGAIQEYAGFQEPRWLDGPPRNGNGTATSAE
jgi:hypothetical protein